MADLVSMKMSKKEAEKAVPSVAPDQDVPEYPYGLCLRLEKEAIGKLGLGKPAGGDEMLLQAKVFVKEVSVTDRADGDGYESLELQITDMALAAAPQEKKTKSVDEMAAALYGAKG